MAQIIPYVHLLPCTGFISPIFNLDFDFASPVFFVLRLYQDLPIWSHRWRSSVRLFTNRVLPHQACTPVPKAAMIYKLANSRPTRAVDTSDNSRGVDSDGGGAAGTSLAGVGAVSANGNHTSEIPFQFQSTSTVAEPNIS